MAARGGLDAAPALRWSREAAREARAVLAYAEAAGHLERALEALELGELGTAAERLALLLEAAATSAEAGELERVAGALRAGGGAGPPARRRRRVRRGRARLRGVPALRRRRRAGARAARGGARAAPEATERPARPGARPARRPARPGDRPAAARGAARRGDRDGPCGRRPCRARAAARALAARELAPGAHRPPARRRRRGARASATARRRCGPASCCTRIASPTATSPARTASWRRTTGWPASCGGATTAGTARVLAATRAIFDGRLEPGRGAGRRGGGREPRARAGLRAGVRRPVAAAGADHRPGGRRAARRAARVRRPLPRPAGVARAAGGGGVGGGRRRRRARGVRGVRAARARARCRPIADLPCTLALLADVSVSVGELRHAAELRERLEPSRGAQHPDGPQLGRLGRGGAPARPARGGARGRRAARPRTSSTRSSLHRALGRAAVARDHDPRLRGGAPGLGAGGAGGGGRGAGAAARASEPDQHEAGPVIGVGEVRRGPWAGAEVRVGGGLRRRAQRLEVGSWAFASVRPADVRCAAASASRGGPPVAQRAVERPHEQRGRQLGHLPQARHHGARAGGERQPAEPDELVGRRRPATRRCRRRCR